MITLLLLIIIGYILHSCTGERVSEDTAKFLFFCVVSDIHFLYLSGMKEKIIRKLEEIKHDR